MSRKGKTFAESTQSKTFANVFTHLNSIPDRVNIPKDVFEKHDVKHAYAETRPDHGMTMFDEASNGEKLVIMDMIDDAVSNQKYARRSSAVPEYVPDHLKEKVRSSQKRQHRIGHGGIPRDPPTSQFFNMSRAQISVLQSLDCYATICRFESRPVESVDEFKNVFNKAVVLVVREFREDEDCYLLSYRMDEAGRFYVCFILDKNLSRFFHFFYSCNCY